MGGRRTMHDKRQLTVIDETDYFSDECQHQDITNFDHHKDISECSGNVSTAYICNDPNLTQSSSSSSFMDDNNHIGLIPKAAQDRNITSLLIGNSQHNIQNVGFNSSTKGLPSPLPLIHSKIMNEKNGSPPMSSLWTNCYTTTGRFDTGSSRSEGKSIPPLVIGHANQYYNSNNIAGKPNYFNGNNNWKPKLYSVKESPPIIAEDSMEEEDILSPLISDNHAPNMFNYTSQSTNQNYETGLPYNNEEQKFDINMNNNDIVTSCLRMDNTSLPTAIDNDTFNANATQAEDMFQVLIKSIDGTHNDNALTLTDFGDEYQSKLSPLLYLMEEKVEKQAQGVDNIISEFKHKFSLPNSKRIPVRQKSKRSLFLENSGNNASSESKQGAEFAKNNLTPECQGSEKQDSTMETNSEYWKEIIPSSVSTIDVIGKRMNESENSDDIRNDHCEEDYFSLSFSNPVSNNLHSNDNSMNSTEIDETMTAPHYKYGGTSIHLGDLKDISVDESIKCPVSNDNDSSIIKVESLQETEPTNNVSYIERGEDEVKISNYDQIICDEENTTYCKMDELKEKNALSEYKLVSNTELYNYKITKDAHHDISESQGKVELSGDTTDKECTIGDVTFHETTIHVNNAEIDNVEANNYSCPVIAPIINIDRVDNNCQNSFTSELDGEYIRLCDACQLISYDHDIQTNSSLQITEHDEQLLTKVESQIPNDISSSNNAALASIQIPIFKREGPKAYEDDDNVFNLNSAPTQSNAPTDISKMLKSTHSKSNLLTVPDTNPQPLLQQAQEDEHSTLLMNDPKLTTPVSQNGHITTSPNSQADLSSNTKAVTFLNSNGSIAKRPMLRHVSQPNMNAHMTPAFPGSPGIGSNGSIHNSTGDQSNSSPTTETKFQTKDLNSDLAKLKATAVRLNLVTRRPSYLEWLEDRRKNRPVLGMFDSSRATDSFMSAVRDITSNSTGDNKNSPIKDVNKIESTLERIVDQCQSSGLISESSKLKQWQSTSIDKNDDNNKTMTSGAELGHCYGSKGSSRRSSFNSIDSDSRGNDDNINESSSPDESSSDCYDECEDSTEDDDCAFRRKKITQSRPKDDFNSAKAEVKYFENKNSKAYVRPTRLWNEQLPSDRLTAERKERIDKSLDWLRKELKSMRSQDQALARQLLSLRHEMHQLRLSWSCQEHRNLLDEVQCDLEDFHEFSKVLDLPSTVYLDTPLKNVGVTRLNISARRFSTC